MAKREVIGYTRTGKPVRNELMEIKSPDGEFWTVWKTRVLEKLFKEPVGTLVRIEYLGNVVSKGSGRSYKNFKIDVARGD